MFETIDTLHKFARAHVHAPDADALLCASAGCTPAEMIAHDRRRVSRDAAAWFRDAVRRRARGEPLAYVLGECEFWSLPFLVTRDVLIPRADTELLVERALVHAARARVSAVLELGTGCGAVAIALARELHCKIVAADISAAALRVAARNCARHRARRVELRRGNWFGAVRARARFDLIAANPPYVAPHDPHLRRGGLRFEPRRALCARANGMRELQTIIRAAPKHLRAGGGLLLEHGCAQGAAVRDCLRRNGFREIATWRDLAGRERVSGGRMR